MIKGFRTLHQQADERLLFWKKKGFAVDTPTFQKFRTFEKLLDKKNSQGIGLFCENETCIYWNPHKRKKWGLHGDKTIFGQEVSKDFLIDFLNDLLVDEKKNNGHQLFGQRNSAGI